MKSEIWVELKILPKKEVLDVEGRAITQTLVENKKPVSDCRYGKYIRICLDVADVAEAEKQAKDLAKYVLYNPLTETCEIKVMTS